MAKRVDITIDQGASFSYEIDLISLTGGLPFEPAGYTASASLKKTYSSLTETAFSADLSTGKLLLGLSAAQTAGLTAPERYVYDAVIKSSETIIRVVEGIATIKPAVTAPS